MSIGFTPNESGLVDKKSEGGSFNTEASGEYATALSAANEAKLAQIAAETAETNAQTHEVNSAASASAASGSATSADSSATSASASEAATLVSKNAAAASATDAQASRVAAETAETNSVAAQTAAEAAQAGVASSALAASVSEANAATSATNAATSETTATTKATEAAASATAAGTSETNAGTSASTATTKATEASASATAAAVSAGTASTKATEASTSATNAGTSESNAAASAGTATTKATEASTSATNASASEVSAANTLLDFARRYLGPKTADPTVDNEGDPLTAGALYYNTTDNVMKQYEGAVWETSYATLSGALLAANNLSDITSVSSALVNLGLSPSNDVSFNSIDLGGTGATEGKAYWDDTEKTWYVGVGGDVENALGQRMFYPRHTHNPSTTTTITAGTPVMNIPGGTGVTTYITPATSDGTIPAIYYLGLAAEDIAPQSTGRIIFFGAISDIDTSAYPKGTLLYLSDTTPGAFVSSPPASPSLVIPCGVVTNQDASEGSIFIRHQTVPYSSEVNYDNTISGLVASNVKTAIDELESTKANVGQLSSNITLFPTTAASDVTGYSRMVTSLADADYDDIAVDVSTGTITVDDQEVGALVSDAGLFEGTLPYISVPTIGNIAKVAGNSNQYAAFYFKIFQRNAAGVETLVATSNETDAINPEDSSYHQFNTTAIVNGTWLNTDRVVIKYYADLIGNTGSEYNFQFGGNAPVRSEFPVPVSVIPSDVAGDIIVSTTAFNGHLSGTDANVQTALETLDDHNHSGVYQPADVNIVSDASYVHTDNNYTSTEKSKLAGVADNANNYSHPATHSIAEVSGLQTALDAKEDNHAHPYVPLTGGTMTGTLEVPTVDLGDWTVTESAGVLYFAASGVNKMKLDALGNLTVVGDVTAYGTI